MQNREKYDNVGFISNQGIILGTDAPIFALTFASLLLAQMFTMCSIAETLFSRSLLGFFTRQKHTKMYKFKWNVLLSAFYA